MTVETVKRIPLEDNMYKVAEYHGNIFASATAAVPFGPGFSEDELDGAEIMEVWATSFSHPEEFVDFYLLSRDRDMIRLKRVMGY